MKQYFYAKHCLFEVIDTGTTKEPISVYCINGGWAGYWYPTRNLMCFDDRDSEAVANCEVLWSADELPAGSGYNDWIAAIKDALPEK